MIPVRVFICQCALHTEKVFSLSGEDVHFGRRKCSTLPVSVSRKNGIFNPNAINSYRDMFDSTMELDIYIPDLKLGIEYDGAHWHGKEVYEKEVKKYQICNQHGIKLIRIKENKQHRGNNTSDVTIHTSSSLDDTILALKEYIKLPEDINTIRDAIAIKKQYISDVTVEQRKMDRYAFQQLRAKFPDLTPKSIATIYRWRDSTKPQYRKKYDMLMSAAQKEGLSCQNVFL